MGAYDTADGVAAPSAADSSSQETGQDWLGEGIVSDPAVNASGEPKKRRAPHHNAPKRRERRARAVGPIVADWLLPVASKFGISKHGYSECGAIIDPRPAPWGRPPSYADLLARHAEWRRAEAPSDPARQETWCTLVKGHGEARADVLMHVIRPVRTSQSGWHLIRMCMERATYKKAPDGSKISKYLDPVGMGRPNDQWRAHEVIRDWLVRHPGPDRALIEWYHRSHREWIASLTDEQRERIVGRAASIIPDREQIRRAPEQRKAAMDRCSGYRRRDVTVLSDIHHSAVAPKGASTPKTPSDLALYWYAPWNLARRHWQPPLGRVA